MNKSYDVIIIGAGASGLMCAAQSSGRGRRTLLLDHGPQTGRKILIAGGGKCNFTNNEIESEKYVSGNPHFSKSALSRYTQWDFLDLVVKHQIEWEEREHGQLFARHSAREIRDMLQEEAGSAGADLKTGVNITAIKKTPDGKFEVSTSRGVHISESLVVATGGLSLPSAGASPLGYKIAVQFGLAVRPTSPGLVPFTLNKEDKERFSPLSGIAVDAVISVGKTSFRENLLFTHRGLSGPVVLQVSNYWTPGMEIQIDLLPGESSENLLESGRSDTPDMSVKGLFSRYLPKRLVDIMIPPVLAAKTLKSLNAGEKLQLAEGLHELRIKPNGTEGSRSAEVTRGGVDVDAISSKTFEAKVVPGLHFIGEVLDVTGWLGGYNLQWAWSSGWCAGQFV